MFVEIFKANTDTMGLKFLVVQKAMALRRSFLGLGFFLRRGVGDW